MFLVNSFGFLKKKYSELTFRQKGDTIALNVMKKERIPLYETIRD